MPQIDQPVEVANAFDPVKWEVTRAEQGSAGAGGRAVLGTSLIILGLVWIAYSAWSAGRTLAAMPLSSPVLAQWIATAAGPLALLGLVWIMFGRTRRRETERFTQSVIAMRTEARSLEEQMAFLTQRLDDSHAALGRMAGELVRLGDETTARLTGITGDLDVRSRDLARHGEALDRAADSARNDIAALLDDLPRAEQNALAMSQTLQGASREALNQTEALTGRLSSLMAKARDTDQVIGEASQRLMARLSEINQAGMVAGESLQAVTRVSSQEVDSLLVRSSDALAQIRSGIDAQAAAVAALVEQATAGIGRAGADSAEALAAKLADAGRELDALTARLAEQERNAQRLFAGMETAVAGTEQQLLALANNGDQRTASLTGALGRLRSELEALAAGTVGNESTMVALADRAAALREGIEEVASTLQGTLGGALGEAEGGAQRLLAATEAARPGVEAMRDMARESEARLTETRLTIDQQKDRLASIVATLDETVEASKARLAELSGIIASAEADATTLNAETAPALVASLVQVKEAATHAAERAREAIAHVIQDGAAQLSRETRSAMETAINDGIKAQLADVDQVAARAVEAARAASDRLSRQMLSIGQTASALEAHIEKTREDQRAVDSEQFARRVSMLIDSMHSASIDVGKVLADEIDDRNWQSYLKGDRAVFTRRAARLIGNAESRAIQAHYDGDQEFQQSVNRYIHDFESMLRRVLAEKDGAMLAVTLLSSDMGKLYAALGAVERRR